VLQRLVGPPAVQYEVRNGGTEFVPQDPAAFEVSSSTVFQGARRRMTSVS
jgi:hypothetical protein